MIVFNFHYTIKASGKYRRCVDRIAAESTMAAQRQFLKRHRRGPDYVS